MSQLLEALQLPLDKLTEEQSRQLLELVGMYSDVFGANTSQLVPRSFISVWTIDI